MKWISTVFMLVIVVSLVGAFVGIARVEGLILFGGPLLLHYVICLWRLIRILMKQGKKRLPGYWEWETVFWDPMAWYDKLWIQVFVGLVLLGCLVFFVSDQLTAVLVTLPLSACSAITFVIACYNPRISNSNEKVNGMS